MTAYRKKYYSEEAWAKVIACARRKRRTQLWAARVALWQEVAAALDEEPASEKAQELCAKWAELAERILRRRPGI